MNERNDSRRVYKDSALYYRPLQGLLFFHPDCGPSLSFPLSDHRNSVSFGEMHSALGKQEPMVVINGHIQREHSKVLL